MPLLCLTRSQPARHGQTGWAPAATAIRIILDSRSAWDFLAATGWGTTAELRTSPPITGTGRGTVSDHTVIRRTASFPGMDSRQAMFILPSLPCLPRHLSTSSSHRLFNPSPGLHRITTGIIAATRKDIILMSRIARRDGCKYPLSPINKSTSRMPPHEKHAQDTCRPYNRRLFSQ